MKIQAVIIAKNEEARLGDCLKSLRPLVDEVIVVDGGSRDQTWKVAKLGGATVHRSALFTAITQAEDFDFSVARNEALEHCAKGAWVLSVDADERVEGRDFRPWLVGAKHSTYEVMIKLKGDYSSGDGPLSRRGTVTGYVPRLFVNDGAKRWRYRCHEMVQPFVANRLLPELLTIVHERSTLRPGTLARNHAMLKQQLREVWAPEWDDDDRLKTLTDLAGCCRDAHEPFEAIGYLNAALAMAGGSSTRAAYIHCQLAGCWFRVGLMDRSVTHAITAWKRVNGYVEPLLIAIACLLTLHRHTDALPLIKAARKINDPFRVYCRDDDDRAEAEWLDNAEAKCLVAA